MANVTDRKQKGPRVRRQFSAEYKASAVRLVLVEGRAVGTVAKELDLTASALSRWVEQARIDTGTGKSGALTSEERTELGQLRREVRVLREEREFLKKATAFFAKERV